MDQVIVIAVAPHVTCLNVATGAVANLHITMSNMQAEENPASSWGELAAGLGCTRLQSEN